MAGALALALGLGGCGDRERFKPAPELPQLRIGMTIGEAKEEIGQRFRLPHWGLFPDHDCGHFEIGDSLIGGLVFEKRIVTVTLSPELAPRSGEFAGLGPEGPRGLRPGQAFARAIELFGPPDRISATESYGGEDVYWKLAEEDGAEIHLRILLDSYPLGEGRIGGFQIGAEPAIYFAEGCA